MQTPSIRDIPKLSSNPINSEGQSNETQTHCEDDKYDETN